MAAEYVDQITIVEDSNADQELSDTPISKINFYDFIGESRFVVCQSPFIPGNWPPGLNWASVFRRLGIQTECGEFRVSEDGLGFRHL